MSRWTHTLCTDCYDEHEPGREAHLVSEGIQPAATCCDCGESADPPIPYRCDPLSLACNGQHGDDAA